MIPATTPRTTRRDILKRAAWVGLGVTILPRLVRSQSADLLPTRVLGKTGAKVTHLGLGTAPVGETRLPIDEGARIFAETLDRGVNYVDTARVYGFAEEMLGEVLPKRRDALFVATKLSVDTADAAEKSLAESLKLMKIGHVDLLHIHNVGSRNVDKVLGPGGVLEFALKAKETGKTRFVGITGHSKATHFQRILESGKIDVVQCVMNYADRHTYNFEETVLPHARKGGCGVVAMKVYVGIKGGFKNHRNAGVGCVAEPERMPKALAYALDLEGVSLAVIGPFTVEQTVQNVGFARAYKPLAAEEREALLAHGKELAPSLGTRYGPAM
jgi:predicted aldo/keto reductase-like oxidoreductase